jgi:hypothetical protein
MAPLAFCLFNHFLVRDHSGRGVNLAWLAGSLERQIMGARISWNRTRSFEKIKSSVLSKATRSFFFHLRLPGVRAPRISAPR